MKHLRRTLLLATVIVVPACAQTPVASWGGGDGTWAFAPKSDDFRADALFDLRSLNEKVAGESGFVQVDANGDFTLGNGKPVRFWCVNTSVGREKPFVPRPLGRQTEPDLARHARFLAKRGVNMIRLHSQVSPDLDANPNAKITDVNVAERDWIWRSVAAMKKEGIYTTFSPYWMVPMRFSKEWGIPGDAGQSAAGLLFFDPTLQAGYKAWLKAVLTVKNPYTGIPLAQDPALAILEIQNEDSLLFWTVNNIQGPQKRNLGKKFGDFVTGKYGSLAKAPWAGTKLEQDDTAAGVLDFYNIWEATQPRTGQVQQRLADQMEFLTRTMRSFNQKIEDFVRNELGAKMVINAGNWRTADQIRLLDLERFSYTSTEVDAVNKYVTGVHKGPNEGWAIVNGDTFTSPSLLNDPKPLPTNLKQTKGRPMLITESSWVPPTGYASEGPLLISAYQSLNGVDGYFWFATGDDEWTPPQSANGYQPSLAKWTFASPDVLGQFPGAALMYRQGYVKRGAPAVSEVRALDDLWQRRTPIIAEEPSFDPNRDAGDIAPSSSIKTGVSASAFLVGPVQVSYGGNPATSKMLNLSAYVDEDAKKARSDTGELAMNWAKGIFTVNTPCAQGASAFFKRQPTHKLSDVTFSSTNTYGTALAVSMDGKPLKSSAKILVQFGTQCRPTNWREKATTIELDNHEKVPGYQVVNYGKAPWQVVNGALDVTIKNSSLKKATVLDANGNAAGTVKLTAASGAVTFKFPPNALYVVLQ